MKEVKIKKIGEELYEVSPPPWCWCSHPYIIEGLRQLTAGGHLPIYVCKKGGFRERYVVATTSGLRNCCVVATTRTDK